MYDIIGDIHGYADNLEILLQKMGYERKMVIYKHPENRKVIIEETLKGKESELPNGITFADKDGAIRSECRVKWWVNSDNRKTFGQMMMECPEELSNDKIPENIEHYSYLDAKPVFFGHYWLKGSPSIESNNAVCLDYSVAKGGKLVAYRFNLDNVISKKYFIY